MTASLSGDAIRRSVSRWSTLLGVSLLTAACHHTAALPGSPEVKATPVTIQVLPLDRLFVLEISGVGPGDTALAIDPTAARTVILRHGPPDNDVFVVLSFPAKVFTPSAAQDSVHLVIRPSPGLYGIEFECDAPLGLGAWMRFEYPVHFSAPIDAQQRYGSAVQFEAALAIARLEKDARYALLVSGRPAPDNLVAPLAGPGTYIVAAPR